MTQKILGIRIASMRKLIYFTFVGGVGFLVDGGMLTLLSQHYGFDIYFARLASFSLATMVTWVLNRSILFRQEVDLDRPKSVEYARYLLVQTAGGGTNLAIFTLLIMLAPSLKDHPVIPLAVGAIFGLAINFTGVRYWVYSKKVAHV
ncbi:MAG: GtrA family protein [Polaromonas sp.]|nr:GtrA family protein [Polaromonas sp.]